MKGKDFTDEDFLSVGFEQAEIPTFRLFFQLFRLNEKGEWVKREG